MRQYVWPVNALGEAQSAKRLAAATISGRRQRWGTIRQFGCIVISISAGGYE
jgi:hypothetical protein